MNERQMERNQDKTGMIKLMHRDGRVTDGNERMRDKIKKNGMNDEERRTGGGKRQM